MRTLTHRPRPWRALLAVLALVAVFLPAGGVAQAAPPAHMAPAGRAPATAGTAIGGTVTLVTGDKVTLGPARGGSPTVRFRPRHGGDPGTELNFAYGTRADNGVGTTDYPVITTDDVQSGRVFMMPSTRATGDTFHANIRWRLEPTGRVRPGIPDSYDLLYTRPVLGPELWPVLSERDVQRMARLDETFPAVSGPGTYGFGQAYDLDGIAFIYYRPVDVPGHRVSLLTAEPTSLWYQCLVFPEQPVAEMCDQPHAYRPGSRHATTWATGLHAAVTYAAHSADTMGIDTGMADFEHAGHADFARMRDVRLALYREGDLVGERNDTFGYFAIPDGAADFRLEQSYTLAPDALPMARDVRTTWTFHSAPPADPTQATASLPPILDLGYAPDVDSFGRARAGHALKVTVTARHLGNASPPVPDVSGARLSYSVDGGTSWHLLRLLRAGDGTWRTLVPGNALRHGTSVSVRAHATDAAGGTIDQTVLGMVPVA